MLISTKEVREKQHSNFRGLARTCLFSSPSLSLPVASPPHIFAGGHAVCMLVSLEASLSSHAFAGRELALLHGYSSHIGGKNRFVVSRFTPLSSAEKIGLQRQKSGTI